MKEIAIILIKLYQKLFSPRVGVFRFIYNSAMFTLNPGWRVGCRQNPSCSDYCLESIGKLGLIKGLKASFLRIINCR